MIEISFSSFDENTLLKRKYPQLVSFEKRDSCFWFFFFVSENIRFTTRATGLCYKAVFTNLCLALLQPCPDHSVSVALWLTRRLGLLVYDGPCLNLVRGDVSRDSFSLWIWVRVQTALSTTFFNVFPYIFLIWYYITMYVSVPHFYDLSALVGCWYLVSIRRIIYKFSNVFPFCYTAVAVSGKVGRP